MDVQSLTQHQIQEHVKNAKHLNTNAEHVRMLFVPNNIDAHNFGELCTIYKTVVNQTFDTVVVIESYTGHLQKKLAMPSNKVFETRFGEVPVNDFLRNEFCDEEDDFFIADEGYSKEMSLYTQLPILQSCFSDFEVVSLQIGDYDPAIIRELAYTLDELLLNRNALIVYCCDVPASSPEELEKLRSLVVNNKESGLMHYLNSNEKTVKGARAFMSGILVARSWGYDVEFLDHIESATNICGYAKRTEPQMA
ncbi:MAG: AmmeMemoRadiSam system protein B [Gracilimonas sp.]|uniref:AmmeMemoRadiSam system protein B n=1 Tax=Gracilimonas sp. TaxID=1974203 RepID=UPI001B299ABF|nr:AmmeMemoRadiSam system protein B [Gracilimonas sp.]MBO6586328.1 AmmeMemoRadiSam system protein B [Gracilimonas sp.]MBO6614985.1 AmmeMemoRadiSam system protein B [Gracilimonas sp.]